MLWMLVSRTLVTRVEENVVTVLMIVTLVTTTSRLCLPLPVEFELVEFVVFVGLAFKRFRAVFAFIAPSRALLSIVSFLRSIGRGSRHLVMMNVALSWAALQPMKALKHFFLPAFIFADSVLNVHFFTSGTWSLSMAAKQEQRSSPLFFWQAEESDIYLSTVLLQAVNLSLSTAPLGLTHELLIVELQFIKVLITDVAASLTEEFEFLPVTFASLQDVTSRLASDSKDPFFPILPSITPSCFDIWACCFMKFLAVSFSIFITCKILFKQEILKQDEEFCLN